MNKEPEFIFKRQHAVGMFEIKYNGKHWTSYHTTDPIRDKDKIIERAKNELKDKGVEDPVIEYDCPYW